MQGHCPGLRHAGAAGRSRRPRNDEGKDAAAEPQNLRMNRINTRTHRIISALMPGWVAAGSRMRPAMLLE